jgi:hypothetical protein
VCEAHCLSIQCDSKCVLLVGVAVSSASQKLGCFYRCYQFAGNSQCRDRLKLMSALCQEQTMIQTLLTVSEEGGEVLFQFMASNG